MPRRIKNATNSLKTPPGVGISELLGVSVKPFSSSLCQYECEMLGGEDDGFTFTRIVKSKPTVGTRMTHNGVKYKLVSGRNGAAVFRPANTPNDRDELPRT